MTATEERAERTEEARGGGGGRAAQAGPAPLQRAASELQLRQEEAARTPDAASLQDEPLMDDAPGTPFLLPMTPISARVRFENS